MSSPTSPAELQWHDLLRAALTSGTLIRATLGGYSRRDQSIRKLYVRPILLKDVPHLSFLWRHDTRDVTRNFPHDEGLALLVQDRKSTRLNSSH